MGTPEGFSCRLLGRWGGRGPSLSLRVLVESSAVFLWLNGSKTGSFAAQWEDWEGTSPFIVPDPAVAWAGHLNVNEKYIASGWSGDLGPSHPTIYLFSFSPCFLSWLQSKAFSHLVTPLMGWILLCLATCLAEGVHSRSPPSSLKPG